MQGSRAQGVYEPSAKTLMYLFLPLNTVHSPIQSITQSSTMHNFSTTSVLLAILSTILIQYTHCLPTTHLLPEHPIYSLPPLQPNTTLNASSNGNCASRAKYPSWSSPDWVVEDCYTARQQLYVREVLAQPNIAYEFLAQGLSPRQHPLGQRTPRKYIVGKWSILGGDVTLMLRVEEVLISCRYLRADDHDA